MTDETIAVIRALEDAFNQILAEISNAFKGDD
jgi:hypothetical protein